jgi:hypothetical protein
MANRREFESVDFPCGLWFNRAHANETGRSHGARDLMDEAQSMQIKRHPLWELNSLMRQTVRRSGCIRLDFPSALYLLYYLGSGMPYPLAHPAAVLPLRRLCPRRLSFPALVVGSLCPDVGYPLGVSRFSHSFSQELLFFVCQWV